MAGSLVLSLTLVPVLASFALRPGAETDPWLLRLARRALQDQPGEIQTLKDAKQTFERKYLITVLRITHGHVANAARIAGRNRTEFYKLLGQHAIDPADFRQSPNESQADQRQRRTDHDG